MAPWEEVRRFLEAGGVVLWAIALLAACLTALIVERYLFFRREFDPCMADKVTAWRARAERSSGEALFIRAGLIAEAEELLERNLALLRVLVALCPLLGVLGTVLGMMALFQVIALLGTGNPRALAAGIRHQETPKAEVQALLGGAHLSLGQHREAARALEEALALTREPRENWMQSLLSAYFELKAHERGQTLLEKMVRLFPDKGGYWRQLAGILLLRDREKEALAVLELAHLAGYAVEERDLLNLAQLHLQRHAPFKAALLLTDEMTRGRLPENGRNLELAAHAWQLARERGRAVALLEKAWNQEERLALGVGLAQLYAEERQWERVVGLLAGPLTRRQHGEEAGRAWILLGMARFETGKREEARDAFQRAAAFQASRKEAEQWLAFLGREGSDADASS